MDIEIIDSPLAFDLFGLTGDVTDHDYAGTGKRLMDEMWARVKNNALPHKGINFWVYDSSTRMFTVVELQDGSTVGDLLEHKTVCLRKYAYYKYVGPYQKLGETHRSFEGRIDEMGLTETGPRIERYGDWVADETKLVTEIFIGVK